jgi:hypothetical protein
MLDISFKVFEKGFVVTARYKQIFRLSYGKIEGAHEFRKGRIELNPVGLHGVAF